VHIGATIIIRSFNGNFRDSPHTPTRYGESKLNGPKKNVVVMDIEKQDARSHAMGKWHTEWNAATNSR